MKAQTRILAYFDRYSSPTRERVIGFWFIVLPTVLIMLLAALLSSCSPAYTCAAVDGTRYSRKAVTHQIRHQENYRLVKR